MEAGAKICPDARLAVAREAQRALYCFICSGWEQRLILVQPQVLSTLS